MVLQPRRCAPIASLWIKRQPRKSNGSLFGTRFPSWRHTLIPALVCSRSALSLQPLLSAGLPVPRLVNRKKGNDKLDETRHREDVPRLQPTAPMASLPCYCQSWVHGLPASARHTTVRGSIDLSLVPGVALLEFPIFFCMGGRHLRCGIHRPRAYLGPMEESASSGRRNSKKAHPGFLGAASGDQVYF